MKMVIYMALSVILALSSVSAFATESTEASPDLPDIPDGVEIWIRNENNYALLDPAQNTWTARIGAIGETVTFELTRDENGQYQFANNVGEIKPTGDELDVFYYEYGVTCTYHRGTPEEYAENLARYAKYSVPAWLIGEWKLEYDWEFGDRGDPLVIREDGTCLFQGTEYAWENGVVRGRTYFGITLYLNERPQYCILKDADRVQIISQLTNSFTYVVK